MRKGSRTCLQIPEHLEARGKAKPPKSMKHDFKLSTYSFTRQRLDSFKHLLETHLPKNRNFKSPESKFAATFSVAWLKKCSRQSTASRPVQAEINRSPKRLAATHARGVLSVRAHFSTLRKNRGMWMRFRSLGVLTFLLPKHCSLRMLTEVLPAPTNQPLARKG